MFFSKGSSKAHAGILVFILFLILLSIPSLSKIQKFKKIKRDLSGYFNGYQDDGKMNVKIIPTIRRKNQQHPNHRYSPNTYNRSKILKNEFSGRFASKSQPIYVQDVILKSEVTTQRGKSQSKFINEMLKGSEWSMRLKGVYKQSGGKEGLPGNQLDEKYRYSKEINNLMQHDPGNEGKRLMKNEFKAQGAPFQLPLKGPESSKRQQLTYSNIKKHPITIYLDFYPMDFESLKRNKINRGSNTRPFLPKKSTNVYKSEPHPMKQNNGIIMKLNLYPKESVLFQKNMRKPAGGFQSKYNAGPERKSYGRFSVHRKKCSFLEDPH